MQSRPRRFLPLFVLCFGAFLTAVTRSRAAERVILDVDPGNDDALAMLLALDSPALHVEAVTVCPGNLGPNYAQQVRNALYVVEVAGKSGRVPVHAGMTHPILNKPYPIATFIHGKFGLGRVEVPEVAQQVEKEHAVDTIIRLVRGSPGEITIVAVGALSNVAMAVLRDPQVAKDVKGILMVGGRYANAGMAPGYNMLADPEAAHVVFTSGAALTLVTSDAIRNDSILLDADFDHIAAFNTKRSKFFIESNDLRRTFEKASRGTAGSTNPDPLAVATLINPAVAKRYVSVYMHIELNGESSRGMLIFGDNIYTQQPTPPPNVKLCVQASNEDFKRLVFETLARP